MAPAQGWMEWGRMQHFLYGSFSLAHGVTPSICRITAAAQSESFAEIGSLRLTYGNRIFQFDDCHLKHLDDPVVDDEGRQMALLTIEDRRWRWRGLGRISGYYNRVVRSTNLRPDAKRGLRELMALCLSALGESGFDISRVDNDDGAAPAIEWDYEDPIIALAQLLEFGRCRLVLRPDGRVAIFPRGVGLNIQPNEDTIILSRPIDAPDRPSKIVVAMGRTLYETSMALEPVALNRKNQWVELGKEEYTPFLDVERNAGQKGWSNTYKDFSHIKDPVDRSLAQRSVHRAYRIVVPFKLKGAREIKDLVEILPISTEMVREREGTANKVRRPATVQGLFYGGFETPEPEKEFEVAIERKDGWRFARNFTILEEEGIVLFDEPVVKIVDNGAPIKNFVFQGEGQPDIVEEIPRFQYSPADITITTSFNLREKDVGGTLRGWERFEVGFPISAGSLGAGAKVSYITNDIRRREVIVESFSGLDSDNKATMKPFATLLVDGEKERLNFNTGKMIEYAGWYPIYPDGLVAQTTWRLEGDGRAIMETLSHVEDLTSYQSTREYLAQIKADRQASILRSEEQRVIDARLRAL
jgi:hypothetical protein